MRCHHDHSRSQNCADCRASGGASAMDLPPDGLSFTMVLARMRSDGRLRMVRRLRESADVGYPFWKTLLSID